MIRCPSMAPVYQFVYHLCTSIKSFVVMVVYRCTTCLYLRAHGRVSAYMLYPATLGQYKKLLVHTGTPVHSTETKGLIGKAHWDPTGTHQSSTKKHWNTEGVAKWS